MNQLIPIQTNDQMEPIISGRDLHQFLEVGTRYDTWFDRMKEYGFEDGKDFIEISEEVDTKKRARTYEQINHNIKLDMSKDICRKQRRNIRAAELYQFLQRLTQFNEVVYVEPTRLELSFESVMSQIMDEFGFHYKPQYNINGYRIDFYFPDLNLAVEYDEAHHFSDINMKRDFQRQKAIGKELNCTFIRLDYKQTDITNTAKVLKKIFQIKETENEWINSSNDKRKS